MGDMNFCPYCGVQSHKFLALQNGVFFCRQCEKFFSLDQPILGCPKCNSSYVRASDYPTIDGTVVFHCRRCFTHVKGGELIVKQN